MEKNLKLPCIVTAYIDLSEKIKTKTSEVYLSYFSNLLNLKNEIIVFYDPIIETKLKELTQYNKNVKLLKIDKTFFKKNIKSSNYLDRQYEILNTTFFQNLKKFRLDQGNTPEVNIPEYNIINYAKIDFLNYTIDNKITENKYVCWLDFGLIRKKNDIKDNAFCPEIFYKEDEKVHLIANSQILNRWYTQTDWHKLFIDIWEKVHGGLIFTHKNNLKKASNIIHEEIIDLLDHNIIDDDQVVYFRAKLNNPDFFVFHRFWDKGFDYVHEFINIKDKTPEYINI